MAPLWRRGRFGMAPVPPSPRYAAKPGDLICAPVLSDGTAWLVQTVAEVDDEGFVGIVLDERGRRVAISRVYAESRWDAPHLIVPAARLTPEGRGKMVGFCAGELDAVKVELRRWKADC